MRLRTFDGGGETPCRRVAADIKDQSFASVRPIAEASFREQRELYHISGAAF